MKSSYAILVAIFGVILYFLLNTEQSIDGSRITLGDTNYHCEIIDAPVSTGILLKITSIIASKSIFGPTIRRMLMNNNGMIYLRELAAQTHLEPLYYPMRRLSKTEREANEAGAVNSEEYFKAILKNGFEIHNEDDCLKHNKYYSIEDYAEQYKKGVLPSTVLSKALNTIVEWNTAGHHIFSSVQFDEVMKEAFASDQRHRLGKPLSIFDGVPIALKDMMSAKGHAVYEGRMPTDQFNISRVDDIMVKRLKRLGAIVLGTTIMTEGGMSPLGKTITVYYLMIIK